MSQKINLTFYFFIFLLLSACTPLPSSLVNLNIKTMEKVNLKTEDQIALAANFFPAQTEKNGIILLHQLSKSKESYNGIIPELTKAGFNVLAIDLRGHGQSQGDWRKFSDQDFNNMILDVKAAEKFLKSKNSKIKINLMGASIGANTVLNYSVLSEITAMVALSPGLDFHGIVPQKAVSTNTKTPILFVAANSDAYSADSVNQLYNLSPLPAAKKEKIIYTGSKHGVDMFGENNDLLTNVIAWLNKFN